MEPGCAFSPWFHAGFAGGETRRPELGALAALLGGALGLGAALLGLYLRSRVPELRAGDGVRSRAPRPREERPRAGPPGACTQVRAGSGCPPTQDAVAAFALKAQVVYPINQRYQPLISGTRDLLTMNTGREVGNRRPKARAADDDEELEALPGSVARARRGGAERKLQSSGARCGEGKEASEIEPHTRRGAAVETARRRQALPGCLAEVLVLGSEERLHAALSALVRRSYGSLRDGLHGHRCVLLEMMLMELLCSNGEQRMHGRHIEEMGRPDRQEGCLGSEAMDEGSLEELGSSLSHDSLRSSWFDGKTQLTVCRYLSVVDAYLLQLQDQAVSVEKEAERPLGTQGGVPLDTVDRAPGALIRGMLLGEHELAREAAERAAMLDERVLTWERAVRARVSMLESRQRVLEAAGRKARLVLEAPDLREEQGCGAREAVRVFQCGLLGLRHEFDRRWEEESTALLGRLAECREKRLGARPGLACHAPCHRGSVPELVQRWQEEMNEELKACEGIQNEVDAAEAFAVSQLHESLQGVLLRALELLMEEVLGPRGLGADGARAWLCHLREELRETRVGIGQWRQAQEEREELLAARKERKEDACLVTTGRQRLQEREARILSGVLLEVPGLAPGAVRRAQLQSELWVSLWSSALWVPQPLRRAPRVFSQLWPVTVDPHAEGLQGPRVDAMQRRLRQDVVLCGHMAEVARATRDDLRQRTRTLLDQLLARGALAGALRVDQHIPDNNMKA